MNTLKTLIATIALALVSVGTVSAEIEHVDVDSKAIAAQVRQAPQKRAELLDRFSRGLNLTPQEMVLVYYGEAFTPGYKTIESVPAIDAAYARNDRDEALALIEKQLKSNPVMLNQLFRAYACSAHNKDPRKRTQSNYYQAQINNICQAIFASGTGVSTDSPFYVLSDEDAMAFTRNYLQPEKIIGTSRIEKLYAIKVRWPGQEDDVIFYFARP